MVHLSLSSQSLSSKQSTGLTHWPPTQPVPAPQTPHSPPQPSPPQTFLPQLGTHFGRHKPTALLHCVSLVHVPQLPPQPSAPHCLPLQLGAQVHWPALEQYWMSLHGPQLPPQPSSPHCLPAQVFTHGQKPQSCGQLSQVSPFCGSQLRLPQLGVGQQSLAQF